MGGLSLSIYLSLSRECVNLERKEAKAMISSSSQARLLRQLTEAHAGEQLKGRCGTALANVHRGIAKLADGLRACWRNWSDCCNSNKRRHGNGLNEQSL
jgi:hypothetical protein